MPKFPVDAPREKVLKALELLGFVVVRAREHIALQRNNPDGTMTPMTLPGHRKLKASTLRAACQQANIDRDEFIRAFNDA